MRVTTDRLAEDHGATTLEFALVFPVLAFLIFGLVYGLLAAAAHVSLAHATSRGVRYASLATDPVAGVYPSSAAVEAYVETQTPFFGADRCIATVGGNSLENAPMTLDVSCEFPNPLGSAVSGLQAMLGGPADAYSDTLQMSAHAEGRRE